MELLSLLSGIESFMANQSLNRLYYLDALRSFLILMVVLLHSSQIYNTSQSWLIYSSNVSNSVHYLVDFLQLLCMPTFFIIAGYFSVISFKHSQGNNFLMKRVLRLAIPLFFIAFTLNTLQSYILVITGWKDYDLISYISQGYWIQHLWFLINLIVYTIISYILVVFYKKELKILLLSVPEKLVILKTYQLLFILPLISLSLILLKQATPSYFLGVNINQIISYMPYFFFGILLMFNDRLLKKFTDISISFALVIILLSIMIIEYTSNAQGILSKLLFYYTKALGAWFAASLAFTVFQKYVNYQSMFIYKISDASYSIYLVHHIFVVLIGLVLIKVNVEAWMGLPILFILSVGISYIIHQNLIVKNSLLLFLINGKKSKF